MAVPEAGIPLKLLLSLLAGSGGELGAQRMRSEPVNIPGALLRGATEMALTGTGELLPPVSHAVGHALVKSGLNVGKAPVEEAVRIAEQQAGARVAPSSIDLADEAITRRLAPGEGPRMLPGYRGSGYTKMTAEQSLIANERNALIDAARQRGVTATRYDFVGPLQAEREQIASLPNGSANAKRFDALWKDFIKQGRVHPDLPPGPNNPMKQLDPTQWEKLKEDWAGWAKKAYKGSDEKLAVLDRFSAAIAKAAREKIEGLTPPAVQGGIGRIAELNRNYQNTIPITDALYNAELPRASTGSLKDLNPLHLASPSLRGRAGLALTEPVLYDYLRQAPRSTVLGIMGLLQLLQDKSANDSTAVARPQ